MSRLNDDLSARWKLPLPIILFFVSGLIDDCALAVWGIFINIQTGNILMLANAALRLPVTHHPMSFTKALTSLLSFFVGSVFWTEFHRGYDKKGEHKLRRWKLTCSFLIQTLLCVVGAALCQAEIVSTRLIRGIHAPPPVEGVADWSAGSRLVDARSDNYLDLLPIGLLAFQGVEQLALSRYLDMPDLGTIAMTTIIYDTIKRAVELKREVFTILYRSSWHERQTWHELRGLLEKQIIRGSCMLFYALGACSAASVLHWSGHYHDGHLSGIGGALWIAVGLKGLLTITILVIVPKAKSTSPPNVALVTTVLESNQAHDKGLQFQRDSEGLIVIDEKHCSCLRRRHSTAELRCESHPSHQSLCRQSGASEKVGFECTDWHEETLRTVEPKAVTDSREVPGCEHRCTLCGHERLRWHDNPHGGD